ncbi:MAG: rod shape-determining protein MreD [Caldilineaceae bacterium]|nr:rod shape-determining protein MreD [Caldilineaceae bacterium]
MQISYILMVPLLGALAIIQTVVGPRLIVFGVRPDLILLVIVAWSLFNGSLSGIVWAFVGGLWMDILSGGPMGGSSLALMTASLVTGIGHNRFFRNNLFVPLSAAVLGTLVYSLVYLGVLTLVGHRLSFLETFFGLVLPATLYNSLLMLLLTPLFYRWLERRELDMLR